MNGLSTVDELAPAPSAPNMINDRRGGANYCPVNSRPVVMTGVWSWIWTCVDDRNNDLFTVGLAEAARRGEDVATFNRSDELRAAPEPPLSRTR